MSSKNKTHQKIPITIGIKAYVALIISILIFSGLFFNIEGMEWLGAFDFTTLCGSFGKMLNPEQNIFIGEKGISAKAGFLFSLTLVPTVMLATGLLEVFTYYGAIRAAHHLLTPLLRPLLGLPGLSSLALITDLQSTDVGAKLTKELYDAKLITKKNLIIMGAWQYSGAGLINNYFAIGSVVFSFLLVPIIIPLIIMLSLKFVGATFVRLMLNTWYKKDFVNE
ncbi:MAG: hypothetical protein J6562_03600 [Candidatus Schmidhempelia sp.]|nr:hypothetical protein [Candidatus Schmidhempelia sp.]